MSISLHNNLITKNVQGVNLDTTNHTQLYTNEIIDNLIGITEYNSEISLFKSNVLDNALYNLYYINDSGVVMQNDIWSCGPATLATLMKLLGFNVTQEELYNLSKTDNTGTSIYSLIQAAKLKGLNLTGVQISIVELKVNNIVLFDFDGEYHFSLIKAMNETHMMFSDSYFGNFELTFGIFEEYFSGFAIVLTGNISDNCTILSDEQLKTIKGTFININKGGIKLGLPGVKSVVRRAATVLLRSPYVLVFAAAVQVGLLLNPNVGAYGPSSSYKTPKKSGPSSYSPKFRYKTPKIPRYARSPTGKIKYIPKTTYLTPAVKIAQEYQRNYEKYQKLKGKEFAKIGNYFDLSDLLTIKLSLEIYQSFVNGDHKEVEKVNDKVTGDGGNETKFWLRILKYVKNSPREGYNYIKNGHIMKGIGRLALGTGLGELFAFQAMNWFISEKGVDSLIEYLTKE